MPDFEDRQPHPARGIARRWLPVAAVILLMAAVFLSGWHRHLSLETLAANEQSLRELVSSNRALALAAYAALYAAAVALSIPGALILTISGGFLFGWLAGGLTAVVAATAGACAIFLIAQTTVGDRLAARAGSRLAALRDGFRRDAFNYLLFLRLVPAFPFWLVNLAPALLGVRLPVFVAATALGILPGTFAFAVVGSGLDSVFHAQRQARDLCLARAEAPDACQFSVDPSALLTPGLVAAFVALGVLALVPVAIRRIMARRGLEAGDRDPG
jgi:uncharacterized membrane protein YdjX (TVP38/TMEM64 family)